MITEEVRVYNPGLRISDTFVFSLEPADRDLNYLSRWTMDAPKNGWFVIPRTIQFGDSEHAVTFVKDVLRRYADRGFTMLDKNWQEPEDEATAARLPIAATEEAAEHKGETRWKEFCTEKAKLHIDQCLACQKANMPPVPASGSTKIYLEVAGMLDPADAYFRALKEQSATSSKASADVLELKSQVEVLTNQLKELLSASGKAAADNGEQAREPKPARARK